MGHYYRFKRGEAVMILWGRYTKLRFEFPLNEPNIHLVAAGLEWVELHQNHGLAVLVAIGWSRSPRTLETGKPE